MAALGERLRLGPRRGMLLAAFVVALLLGFVMWQSWAGYKVTGDTIVAFVVTGIVLGSIYAVAATGLVVTYTTSGVFNFAQGAIGTLMAFVYWQLHDSSPIDPQGWGLPTLLAFLLTVVVAAPLLGAGIERAFMRKVADAPLVAQLVTTIGLTFGLIGLVGLIWDQSQSHVVRQF